MPTSHLTGVILIVSATFFLSLSGVIVRTLTVDDWTIVFWRSLFMTLTMLAVLAVTKKGRVAAAFRDAGRAGLYIGITIGLALVLYVFSITRTTVANTLVLVASAPLFAALLGIAVLKERVRPRAWTAMAVAAGGIALMFVERMGVGELLGNLFAIAAAVLYAISIVVMRGSGGVNLIPAVCIAGIVSMAVTLPYADLANVPFREMGILAAMGVGQIGLGLVLFVFGAQRLPPAETALIALVETILAPLWVWLAINEIPSDWALIGGAVLFAAVFANTALSLRRRPSFG
jgi:drug/metabolite transporter (DMT)-like permease